MGGGGVTGHTLEHRNSMIDGFHQPQQSESESAVLLRQCCCCCCWWWRCWQYRLPPHQRGRREALLDEALCHLVGGGVHGEVVEDDGRELHEHPLERLPLLALLVAVDDAHVVEVVARRGCPQGADLGRRELEGTREGHLYVPPSGSIINETSLGSSAA